MFSRMNTCRVWSFHVFVEGHSELFPKWPLIQCLIQQRIRVCIFYLERVNTMYTNIIIARKQPLPPQGVPVTLTGRTMRNVLPWKHSLEISQENLQCLLAVTRETEMCVCVCVCVREKDIERQCVIIWLQSKFNPCSLPLFTTRPPAA